MNAFRARFRNGAAGMLLGLGVVLATASLVAAATPDPILPGGLYAQNALLGFRWSSIGAPPTAMKTAISAGVTDANTSRRSKAPSFAYDAGSGNLVYYGTDVPCGVGGLACMRRDTPGWFGLWFRENGHRYDWGTLRWCELSGAPDGCFEIESVTLHELGHVMVLDHHVNLPDDSDYLDAVMQTYQRAKPRAGWNAHAYARCDTATLQQQYDVATSTTLYSTCLDIPTRLSMTASPTAIVSGSTVTFTAALTSDGTGRLSGNAMAARVVVLQQRSGAGWADMMTMSAGPAGSYTASFAIRVSQEYRALFRKPASEGVRASASGSVTISVTAACTQAPCPLAPGDGR